MLKAINEISKKNHEANKLLPKFIKLDGELENVEFVCTKTDGTKYDFNRFSLLLKFIAKIHNYEITLNEAIEDQTKLRILINKLNNEYNPRSSKNVKEKERVLESARKLSDARDEIIFFEKGVFLYIGNVFKTKEKEESEKEPEGNKFLKYIENESESINHDLFKEYFNFIAPTVLAKKLFETKDEIKNNDFVNVIKSRIHDLKD